MTKPPVDVCIIGGGLVGCFAALFLAERGRTVTLIEKRVVGGQASGVNFGNLRLEGRDAVEFPLALAAHDIWERFEAITGETGGVEKTGHAYMAFGAQDHARLDLYAREANAAGIAVELLDRADVRRRWPALSSAVTAATWSSRDAVGDPKATTAPVARMAAQKGATILEHHGVTRFTRTGAGFSVATDRGASVSCATVVNAAGAWAGAFAAAIGEPVPMFAAGPPIIATAPAARLNIASMQAVDGSIIVRQSRDGCVITSSFPRQPSDLDSGASPIASERIARDLERLGAVVPALQGIAADRAWSGVEGYLPDMLPVLGPSRKMAGVIHAFGLSGHGYQLAPGVGRVVADLCIDQRTMIPIAAFDIARFTGTIKPSDRLAAEFDAGLVATVTASKGRPHD